jgi:serine protease Do
MMSLKKFSGILLIAVLSALIAVVVFASIYKPGTRIVEVESRPATLFTSNRTDTGAISDFTVAAEQAIHSVVHVKTKAMREAYSYNPLYEFFYGERQPSQQRPVMGFGSGVILSEDGYIVTNNHVIQGMDEIEVVLNDKRSFTAEIIGTDRSTDLALLKIDAKNLSPLGFGDSDALKLGEWVLAVGNPYNLTSTVTAGIVSAKARNINILQDQFPLESFIQTDAAVNPGNSGGALVNTYGELVGINTAIASRTGAFTGYSFAIPVSIVRKVVTDIMEFGNVQRAILGVTIQDITQELAKEKNLKSLVGVYVNGVRDDGAAKDAGIKEGDIILSVNNFPTNTASALQEQVSRYRPGDKVNVLIKRDNKEKPFTVTLRNMEGNTGVVQRDDMISSLGASFVEARSEELSDLKLKSGVRVVSLSRGKLAQAGVKEGFIITKINNSTISTVNDIRNVLSKIKNGGVYIEGVYPDGSVAYYAFGM